MTNPSWDPHGEVRGALRAVVADPELGTGVLSSPKIMSNILRDFLPDAPREANLLIAASDADVPGKLRTYLGQGMDASVAQGIVASVFAEQTALTRDACQWVVHEIAIALGVPPHVGVPPVPKAAPIVSQRPTTVDKAATPAPPTAPMGPSPVAPASPQRDGPAFYPGQPARPGQPVQPAQPAQPQFQGQPAQPQYPVRSGQPVQPGQPGQPPYLGPPPAVNRPGPYQAQQPYPGQPGMLPYASAPPRRKSKRNVIIAVTTSGVAVLLIVAILYVLGSIAIPPSRTVTGLVTGVPVRTLDAVGTGKSYSDAVHRINGARLLTSGGKPEVLYIGAAFCPFCAANQWPIIVALSRFGTFAGLTNSRSAPKPESYPDTATLTFDKATYSSKYLTFVSVESQNVNRQPLQSVTPQESRLWKKYGHFYWPFLDVGDRFYTSSLYDPALLQGKSQKQIAAALSNASSPIAQAVDGSANEVTAAICSMTGNQPTSVCDTSTITAIERGL